MNTEKKFGFATRQIHAGHMENAAGSLCAPIYQTSTFAFSTVQQGGARFAGEEGGYIYTRLGNPTLGAVEEKLASLEGGEAAMAAASGMGAISSALWTSVVAGDEIVADETLYGCTYALLNHGMTKFGVKVTLTDLSDIENLKKNLTDKTRVVYFETPCNPTLKLLDNRRAEYGRLAPQVRYPGVVWIGNLNFDGTDLDIFSVRETVLDKDGTIRLFPATSAMVTAPDCGHMMYGRVDQIEDDNEYHSFAMQRVPKFVVDKDKDTRKLRLASRPLAAPRSKAPWMYAANVVGT